MKETMVSRKKKALSRLSLVAKNVRENISPNKGVSNVLVNNLANLLCEKYYHGVFSADDIPAKRLAKEKYFCIIVNLATKVEPVGHFVTIGGTPSKITYIDPYGFPCTQPHVVSFLQSCRRSVKVNRKQVQHKKSVYCGLFAILFAKRMDYEAITGQKLLFRFYSTNRKRNDALCMKYLREMS